MKSLKLIIPFLIVITLFIFVIISCEGSEFFEPVGYTEEVSDYKEEMRSFVIDLSKHAKQKNPNFSVIPQNGVELVTLNGTPQSPIHTNYLSAIDAHGQESLFYGYNADDEATPKNSSDYTSLFLNKSKNYGNTILTIDYCSSPDKINTSYNKNNAMGYISFAANERNLTAIPPLPSKPYNENAKNIKNLSEAKNFLYILNTVNYTSKEAFITAVTNTNYDALIIDAFFNDAKWFTLNDINRLKQKANGGKRLVISYLSIGEAEEYRFYWQDYWKNHKPSWLAEENPNWENNHKVKYWDPKWKRIIYGNKDAYLDKIIDIGFDGVYLDIIDAFQYFENQSIIQ